MPWYLILTAGLILGALADRALIVLGDYLTRRPVTQVQTRPTGLEETQQAPPSTPPRHYSAKDVLGYYDLGGRWVAPTYPGGLVVWDALYGKQVSR